MAENTVRGRFVWHELMTPDTQGAQSFYTKVLGWKTQPWEHDPSYSMFAAASGPLGGTVQESGTPRWLHYIGTDDIDATVAAAKSKGGQVKTDVTSIPNGGKYAVLSDPQGATFAVYQSSSDAAKETPPKRGEFSWHELATTDEKAAMEFYSAVFGWETLGEHDMGADGVYRIFGSNGVQRGGIWRKPAQMPGPPAWLGYVRVKSVDDIVKKVKSARGTLVNGPMEVPGGDWIAQFLDPYGAMFAVHALAADVKASKPAGAPEPSAPPREEVQFAAEAETPKAAAKSAKQPAAKKAPAKKAAGKKAAAQKTGAKKKAAKKKGPAKRAKAAGKKAGKKKQAAKRGGASRAAKKKGAGGRKKAAKRKARKAK